MMGFFCCWLMLLGIGIQMGEEVADIYGSTETSRKSTQNWRCVIISVKISPICALMWLSGPFSPSLKGNISKKTVITFYSAENMDAINFVFGTNTASYTLSVLQLRFIKVQPVLFYGDFNNWLQIVSDCFYVDSNVLTFWPHSELCKQLFMITLTLVGGSNLKQIFVLKNIMLQLCSTQWHTSRNVDAVFNLMRI